MARRLDACEKSQRVSVKMVHEDNLKGIWMATETTESAAGGEDLALMDMGELEARLEKCRGLIEAEPVVMRRAVLIAKAIQVARKYIRANIDVLFELQGCPLGFLTDKEYSKEELINPLTEAAIMGLPFVGNCVNVLANRLYVPKGGWQHRFKSTPAASWPELHLGCLEIVEDSKWVDLPEEKWYQKNGKTVKQRAIPGMAKCECWAKCTFNGIELRVQFLDLSKTGGLDERIAIRVNSGMTEDAVRGKVEARLYKALWTLAMGAGAPGTNDGDDAPPADDKTVEATATSAPAAPVATETPKPADASPFAAGEPEPGSFEEYASLMARAGSIAVAAEIRGRYVFEGELAQRANDVHAARKAELRAQANGQR